MGIARKGSKSVTFYLDESLDQLLTDFATKTFRTKSNAAELLLRKALEDIGNYDDGVALPERPPVARRKAGELLDRPPKKPGRKPKPLPPIQDEIPEKKRGRVKKAAAPAPAPAAAPKRGRPRKSAAA